jgi:hypothetical protein
MPTKAKQPPRFLPTLTEVVQTGADAPTASPGEAAFAAPLRMARQGVDVDVESPSVVEMNVSKILFRLEGPLQNRLKLAVGEIIQGHVDALMPLIAQEIEAVVRETVREGVSAELVRSRKAAG